MNRIIKFFVELWLNLNRFSIGRNKTLDKRRDK